MPLPKRHDFSDYHMAMDRTIDEELFVGLFYQEDRPTFSEQMDAYAERAREKK
jgi:hypothetical protein